MQRRYADMRSENKSKKDEQNAARAEVRYSFGSCKLIVGYYA